MVTLKIEAFLLIPPLSGPVASCRSQTLFPASGTMKKYLEYFRRCL